MEREIKVSDPTLKGLGLGQRETPKPELTRGPKKKETSKW